MNTSKLIDLGKVAEETKANNAGAGNLHPFGGPSGWRFERMKAP